MSDIEKRARELLAQAFACDLSELSPEEVRAARAVLAYQASLTPPEGYAEAIRDAARYRYIRGVAAGEPTDFGQIEDAAFAAHYGDPAQFDFNIDEQMAGFPEVKP